MRTQVQMLQDSDSDRAKALQFDGHSASANLEKVRRFIEGEGDVAQLPPSLLSVSMPPQFSHFVPPVLDGNAQQEVGRDS